MRVRSLMALSLVVAVGAGGCGGNSGDEPAAQAGQAGMGGSLAGAGGVPGGNGGGEAAGQGGAGAAGQGGGGGATGGVGGAAGEGGSGGAAGSGGEAPDVPPPAPSDAWCDRVVAGPAGTKSPAVDLSAAHASVRFFGPDPSRTKADGALSDALGADDPWALPALQAYVSAVGDGCALGAVDSGLPDASVTLSEQVAIIKPGKGAISLPAGATVVAVDLRGLPAVEGLGAAVEQAVGLALAAPVARSKARVRQHYGLTDEVYAPLAGIQNIYTNTVENVARPAIAGSAPADLPLVLLTGPQLAPEAAEIAATLRLGKRAWIAGEDLLTAVAEAHWFGVGSAGIAHRDRMIGGTTPWPDAIAADVRTPYPERHAAELAAMGAPPAVSSGPHARPPIAPLAQTIPAEEGDATIGGARAALTVAHGATRLFFPYFSVVGDTIDETLSTELTALDTAPSPLSLARPASRFSAGLHDSHSWIFQYPLPNAPPSKLRIIPLLLDDSDQGEAVVRRSALADIPRGEVLLAIGGKALSDITAALSPLLSASTPGALRRDLLQYSLYVQNGEGVSIDLRAADGTTHSVMVATESLVKGSAGLAVSTRPNGSLADLGAADLFYVNLDGPIFKAPATSKSVMTQAQNAKGLVIDARGYPGTQETWDFIKRVLKTKSVIQLDVDQISPIERVTQHDEQAWEPLTAPRFEGPIVVLIGPSTQSQAEHILIPLVNEKRATFLGRQTAGADGNITGVMLPGHLGMTFTGTRVRFADGSVFHGHGILPDMELKPTQAQLSASEDPELLAAVAMLK